MVQNGGMVSDITRITFSVYAHLGYPDASIWINKNKTTESSLTSASTLQNMLLVAIFIISALLT